MPAGQEKLIRINFKHSNSVETVVKIGSKLILNHIGEEVGLGYAGDNVEVSDIILQRGDYDRLHLIRFAGPHPAWDNEKTEFLVKDVERYFDFNTAAEEEQYCITKDVVFKKRNLKGLECKIVAPLDTNTIFVEFEEDVGGCSCDSLGKRGCCVAVHMSCIGIKTKPKKVKEEQSYG